MVWAWMSTVLTRLPLTTTSRRRPVLGAEPGVCGVDAFDRLHPTKASPATAPAISSPEIGISVLLERARPRAVQTYQATTTESRFVANRGCYSPLMCGRFYLTASPAEIRKQFKLEKMPELVPRYNIAPMQTSPIVVADENLRALYIARWGLVPSWSRDLSPGAGMINAPAETLEEK